MVFEYQTNPLFRSYRLYIHDDRGRYPSVVRRSSTQRANMVKQRLSLEEERQAEKKRDRKRYDEQVYQNRLYFERQERLREKWVSLHPRGSIRGRGVAKRRGKAGRRGGRSQRGRRKQRRVVKLRKPKKAATSTNMLLRALGARRGGRRRLLLPAFA